LSNKTNSGETMNENSLPYEVNHIFANVDIDAEDLDYARISTK
jgi:hypothetical protein